MKKLVTIVAMLSAFSAFASRTNYNGTVSVKSTISEADLVLKAEAMIPGIVNFTNKEIRREASYQGCNFRRARDIKMKSMKVSKFFKSVDSETFEPVYVGSIGYTIRNCRDRD